jgi:hypothetical protein
MTDSFVVLGLAGVRAGWFQDVAQWAHAGSLPVDFVKCLSAEQLRSRLASGRMHSAVLLDAGYSPVDRDLIGCARDAGTAVIVVDDAGRHELWEELGADVVLIDVRPDGLLDALHAHAAPVSAAFRGVTPPPAVGGPRRALLAAVCGAGGTGASTLAIALAQELGPAGQRGTVLVDLCRRAEQAVLHDAGEMGPGIQELIQLCRTATPDTAQVRAHAYAVPERGYALVLGLRRTAAWAGLRPRAVAAALDALQRAFGVVVCDCDSDVEGQAECGSSDVEERNALTRAAVLRADAVFAVGAVGIKGIYALSQVVADLAEVGVAPDRIVPVFNRATRRPAERAQVAAAFSALLDASCRAEMPAPLFVAEREVERPMRDRRRLPPSLGEHVAGAFRATCRHADDTTIDPGGRDGPRRIRPGELGAMGSEVSVG